MPRLLIWNINALAPTVKNFILSHGSVRGFFDSYGADIICFQETKLVDEKLTKELACVEGYESFWAISQKKRGYSGVVTYVRDTWSPLSVEIDSMGEDDDQLSGEGRVVVSDHGCFVLLNVYVPNAGQKKEEISDRGNLKIRFLHALKAKCDKLTRSGKQVVLVGDLNVAASAEDVHPTINWSRMYHPEELQAMSSILKEYVDVWRLQNPEETEVYTVWDEKTSARAFNKGCRIDYVLVSRGLLASMGTCQILDTPPKWSDHAALLVDINHVTPPEPHEPVLLSSKRMKRFDSRAQPSIASMFSRAKKFPVANPDARATAPTVAQLAVVDRDERRHSPEAEEGVAGVSNKRRRAEDVNAAEGERTLPPKASSDLTGPREPALVEEVLSEANEASSGALNGTSGGSRDADEGKQEAVGGRSGPSGRAGSKTIVKRWQKPPARENGQPGIKSFFSKAGK